MRKIGLKPNKGEKIKVHFVGKVKEGAQFTSTYERNLPVVFQLGSGQVINGLDEFFSLAREGVEATVEVPAKLAYGARQIGDISPNSNLVYEVEFLEILEPPVPFDVGKNDTLVLESGLKYIKVKTTNNQKASAHRDVVLDYTGFFENGNIFDSSVERGFPIQFTLGIGQVIKGWDEGVQQMREGEKFRFIIPSQLAYGSKGFLPLIKPNTNLDRKSTRLNSSHSQQSRMPSSA